MTLVTRRALQWRRILIVVVVLIGAAYSVLREPLDNLLTPPCRKPLELADKVAPEQKALLEELSAAELLYCPDVPATLEGFKGPVYWGSDGVNSVLYFAFDEANPISLGDYHFLKLPALYRGDAPPIGALSAGRPSYVNEAPDGAGYYFVKTGAPTHSEPSVRLLLVGHGIPQEGLSGRDFFTDLENVWRKLRREPSTTERGLLKLEFATVTRRWADVAKIWSNEEVLPAGRTDFRTAVESAPAEPVLARVQSGPLGAGVWVAGIVSGTLPALELRREGDTAGAAALEPTGQSLWSARTGPTFGLFAFPRLEQDVEYSAPFWLEADDRDAGREPDAILGPFSIPSATPETPS